MNHRLASLPQLKNACYAFGVCALALLLNACQGNQQPAGESNDADLKSAIQVHVPKPEALPQILLDQNLTPFTGATLDKAALTLEEVIEILPTPEYLKIKASVFNNTPPANAPLAFLNQATPTSLTTTLDEEEPSSDAMRAYAFGRVAYLQGQYYNAIKFLETAARLAPKSAAILQLLGKSYLVSGNPAKASDYLKRAYKLDRNNIEVIFLLGRLAFQAGQLQDAAGIFAKAYKLQNTNNDINVNYLLPYYFGKSLKQLGYAKAATNQISLHLSMIPPGGRVLPIWRELPFIFRRQGLMLMDRGDLNLRLKDYAKAIEDYNKIDNLVMVDIVQLTARQIYTYFMLGQPQQAQDIFITRITANNNEDLIKLAPYVSRHTNNVDSLADALKKMYYAENRPPQLALTVASVLPSEQASDFLTEHLLAKPSQLSTYREYVTRYFDKDTQGVLRTTSRIATKKHDIANKLLEVLLDQTKNPDALIRGFTQLTDKSLKATNLYFQSKCNIELESYIEAEENLAAALKQNSKFTPAILFDLEIKISRGQRKIVREKLDKLNFSESHTLQYEKAKIYGLLGEYETAIKTIKQLVTENPSQIPYYITLANLYHRNQEDDKAEATLWQAAENQRKSEAVYEALFALYEVKQTADQNAWRRVFETVNRVMPNAKITRVKNAEVAAAIKRQADSERIYEELIKEFPGDELVVTSYVGRLARADQMPKAERILRESLEVNTKSEILMRWYTQVVIELGNVEQVFPVMEKMLSQPPQKPSRLLRLAEVYYNWKKYDQSLETYRKAIKMRPPGMYEIYTRMMFICITLKAYDRGLEILDEGIANDPGNAADYLYSKASLYNRMDNQEQYLNMLEEALRTDPDHPGTNNDLAYHWSEQNINLNRALEMSKKAVRSDPANSAYLDTLGWVYYKLGNFKSAKENLLKAKDTERGADAVILDHLGDALWQLGDKDAARIQWQNALNLAERSMQIDPTTPKLIKNLQAKLNALFNNQPPPVAPIPAP